MTYLNLSHIPVGSSAQVQKLHAKGSIRRRLLDMGLTKGATVSCLYQSPFGDPRAYLIRGAVVALRFEEASRIEVTQNNL